MNSVFSLQRTWFLIKKNLIENQQGIFTIFGLFILISFAGLYFFASQEGKLPNFYFEARYGILGACLWILVTAYWGSINQKTAKKEFRIQEIITPNSTLEYWLVSILIFVFMMVVLVLVFKGVDHFVVNNVITKNESAYQHLMLMPEKEKYFTPFNLLSIAILCVGFLGGIVLLLSATAKHAGNFFGLFILVGCSILALNAAFNWILFGAELKIVDFLPMPFSEVKLDNPHFDTKYNNYVISSGVSVEQLLNYVIMPIIGIISAIYYFRLKEREE